MCKGSRGSGKVIDLLFSSSQTLLLLPVLLFYFETGPLYVGQAGLDIVILQPPECWITGKH